MFYLSIRLFADQSHNNQHYPPLANESLLLQKVAEGDWDAYTSLFNHYLPKLSTYIYPFAHQSKQDTEEIIQEVFLKIWEKRDSLLTVRSFDHYLFRMAKNKLLDLIAKKRSARELHRKYIKTRELSHTEPEQSMQFAEYRSIAQKAIGQLSPKLQTVFLLSSKGELSIDEIADRLSLPRQTVKKRLYLASHAVRSYLRAHTELLALLAGLFFFQK